MTDCERFGHDFSASKTVSLDVFGLKKKRVYYCTFCGEERKPRVKKSVNQNDNPKENA